jgi:hypothetical protein
MDRVSQLQRVQSEGLELFTRKNQDYGDAFATFGLIGVLIRIEDKIRRALNIQKNNVTMVDESIRDTLIDLHNYAAMGIMLIDELPVPDTSVLPVSGEPFEQISLDEPVLPEVD